MKYSYKRIKEIIINPRNIIYTYPPCHDDDDGNGDGVLMRNATVMDAKITQI